MALVGRGLLGASVTTVTALLAAPRGWPAVPAALDHARTATELTVFALRVLATGLSAYIALVFLAVVLAALPVTPRAARRLVARWTRVGLAASIRRLAGASMMSIGVLSFAPVTAAGADPAPVLTPIEEPATPTIAPAPPGRPAGPTPTLAPEPGPSPARPSTGRRQGPIGPAPVLVPATPLGPDRSHRPDPSATDPAAADAGRQPAADPPLARSAGPAPTVRVEPGDSFWSIAERELARHLGRTATSAEVAAWWRELVDANRDRLAEPSDPDLLFPGQELRLPPPSTGS